MQKKVRFALVFSFAFLFTLGSSFTEKGDDLDDIFKAISDEVNQNSKAHETLAWSCNNIGHRLTGSKNGALAEEYALSLLKSYGFKNAKLKPFEVEAWSRDTVTLSIAPENSDDIMDLPVTALAMTPVESKVKGEIVDCGNGLEVDFERMKDKVAGKIVIMNLGLVGVPKTTKNLHRSEKTALAIQHGAAGVIMVNQVPKNVLLTGTASVTSSLINIPATCISMESGLIVRNWLKENPHLYANIDMRNFSRMIRARNVVASIKGSKYPNEKIVIGGHLDSWDLAHGAMDNGIGSFSIMDIARVFKKLKLKPKRTIEFVLFMGEEQGLLGSKALMADLMKKDKLNQVKYMINLDMVNNVQGFNIQGRDEMKDFALNVGEKIKKIDPDFLNTLSNRAELHSDNQTFSLQGIPTMEPNGSFSVESLGCYHANCDKMEVIDKKEMEKTVKYTAMYLYAVSMLNDIPAKRLSDEATRQFFIDQNLKSELIIGQEWRWKN